MVVWDAGLVLVWRSEWVGLLHLGVPASLSWRGRPWDLLGSIEHEEEVERESGPEAGLESLISRVTIFGDAP